MNSQSAMGRTNGAVKPKKVEDRHVQANIFSLSFFTVATKPASLHGFLSASTKNNARFSGLVRRKSSPFPERNQCETEDGNTV